MSNQINAKIKIVKTSHTVSSSAANQHNTWLDAKEVQYLLDVNNYQSQQLSFSIADNFLEWYIRTLADEIYKLAFIDQKKFYKIKMFWLSEYDQFEQQKQQMVLENVGQKQMQDQKIVDPITYYLSQFSDFEIEDYFDVIIMPKFSKETKELNLRVFMNSFTYLTNQRVYSSVPGLELFFEEKISLKIKNDRDFSFLKELTDHILQQYIYRQEWEHREKAATIPVEELWRRIVPILKEETRVILYELYKDL